jgi:hypothetical protein
MAETAETYTVEELRDELDDHMDDVAEAADEAAAEGDEVDEAAYESWGETLYQRAAAFDALSEAYGATARIEIAELSPGDRVEYGELLAAATRQWEDRQGVDADGSDLRSLYWVAAGVTDAPWLEGDETLQERAVALRSDGPPAWPAIQHLKGLVTEVNAMESGNVKPFAERRENSSEAEETPTEGTEQTQPPASNEPE